MKQNITTELSNPTVSIVTDSNILFIINNSVCVRYFNENKSHTQEQFILLNKNVFADYHCIFNDLTEAIYHIFSFNGVAVMSGFFKQFKPQQKYQISL